MTNQDQDRICSFPSSHFRKASFNVCSLWLWQAGLVGVQRSCRRKLSLRLESEKQVSTGEQQLPSYPRRALPV